MTFTDTLPTPTPAPAGSRPLAIDLRGLHKSFGTVRAVDGIDLAVTPGEIVAFLGPNGAGKTTTIDMLLGLATPDAGSVSVLGLEPSRAIAEGRVSAVMQSGGLLKDLTVGETVELTGSFFRSARTAREVLARAGIADIADRKVGMCSGGQQQRLRFALALLPDPDLIILDEPTTGMDVEGRRDFWAALRADAALGRTILFATHYLEEADAYADRIVLVSHGRIVADGSAAQVKNLASGRLVSASLPSATAAETAALEALPGVQGVELRGDRLLVRTSDSDGVARHLLTTTSATDVEITARGLEDAFLALTRRKHHHREQRMSTMAVTVPTTAAGRVPRRGLINRQFLAIELRRLVRNRRTVLFVFVMPPAFFLLFGTAEAFTTKSVGEANVTAYIMVSMALYGAMIATTSGGASVSVERAQGWTRQLRLTPLRPSTYVLTKVAVAMVMGLVAVAVVGAVGLASGATGSGTVLAESLALAWIGSIVFAAFGLFMGYLVPSDNAMQVLGPVLSLLAFAGGLFVPLGEGVLATVATFTPTYGLAELVRAPLTGDGLSVLAVVNVVAWAAVFVVGAAWRFRRDTARV